MKNFGGSWTEQKLNAFIKYVEAYLKILNKYKGQYSWQTIYFDGFAGYGKRVNNMKGQEDNAYFEFFPSSTEEVSVYEGSVSRILSLEKPSVFDWYYFIDNNKEYVKNLKNFRKSITHIDKNRIEIRTDDCNSQLLKLANGLTKNTKLAALILLDPFGMQIDWKSIEAFKKATHSDIWILIPSGVGINRLLDKKKQLNHKEKLEKFFGLPINEIEQIFYKSTNNNTLFGLEESTTKIDDPITKIVEIYVRQLKTVWKFVTEKPLVLMNSRNTPIFHFLFASNYKAGFNIASEIITKG